MTLLLGAAVFAALLGTQSAWASAGHGQSHVALCLSGHARSLVEPRVYNHLKVNLIDSLGGDSGSDVFLYLELEERAQLLEARLNQGWDSGAASFSATPEALAEALDVIQPVVVQYHDASPKGAEAAAAERRMFAGNCTYPSPRSRPQLEKLGMCWGLVTRHEASRGFPYEWVVRARPDLGWLWRLPPARAFSAQHVYVPQSYWPMGDQVALCPRALAGVYFNAVVSLSVCEKQGSPQQLRWLRDGVGGPEQLLWKHLFDFGVSVRYYPFPFVIVRPFQTVPKQQQEENQLEETGDDLAALSATSATTSSSASGGGVCASLWNHLSELCVVNTDLGTSPWQQEAGGGDSKGGGGPAEEEKKEFKECGFTLFRAAELVCEQRFPPQAKSENSGGDEAVDGFARDGGRAQGHVDDDDNNSGAAHRVMAALRLRHSLMMVDDAAGANGGDGAAAAGTINGAVHPMLMTSTGGEYRSGQVATAVVLPVGATALFQRALRCALAEYHHALAVLYHHEDGASPLPCCEEGAFFAGTDIPSSAASFNELDTSGEKVGSGAFGAVHAASMLLARSTVRQITCEGRVCESSGKDYDELVTALRHGVTGLASGDS